jgi:hypothetical protein
MRSNAPIKFMGITVVQRMNVTARTTFLKMPLSRPDHGNQRKGNCSVIGHDKRMRKRSVSLQPLSVSHYPAADLVEEMLCQGAKVCLALGVFIIE